ncbi:2-hydroxyacid dehydrogenase, partial [Rhizobium ruizarguesonis]
LEQTYTLHRLALVNGDERDALLPQAGPISSALVCTGHVTIDEALLSKLPALKLAACSSAGYDQMAVEAMTRRGIKLTNTSE